MARKKKVAKKPVVPDEVKQESSVPEAPENPVVQEDNQPETVVESTGPGPEEVKQESKEDPAVVPESPAKGIKGTSKVRSVMSKHGLNRKGR